MRISPYKSEAVVLSWIKMECLLWVGKEVLHSSTTGSSCQVKERGVNKQIGGVSAVMQTLHQAIIEKLSIYWSVFVSTLTLREKDVGLLCIGCCPHLTPDKITFMQVTQA